MAILNEKNEDIVKNIHLMVTSLCNRNCPYCCNRQYNLSDIPQVSDEELQKAENIFITGGEPFAFAQPDEIALLLELRYPNIKQVIVYTNALELYNYLGKGGRMDYIDGLTISLKNQADKKYFMDIVSLLEKYPNCKSNRLYYFDDSYIEGLDTTGFEVSKREWQSEFVPAPDSIFRRI